MIFPLHDFVYHEVEDLKNQKIRDSLNNSYHDPGKLGSRTNQNLLDQYQITVRKSELLLVVLDELSQK